MTKPTRGAINELFALLKPFRLIVSVSIVLGMIGGLSVTVLLATINNALHSADGLTRTVVMIFAGLCVLALLTSILSDIGTNYVGQHIIARLRSVDSVTAMLPAKLTMPIRVRGPSTIAI